MVTKKFSTRLFSGSSDTLDGHKKTPRSITKVLTADILLSTPVRSRQFKEIQVRVSIPDKYFLALYEPVIQNLAEFLQSLPDTIRPYTVQGGLLTHALERGVNLLRLRENHFFNNPKTAPHQIESEKPLWTYVLFTATLLRDVGLIAASYPVQLVSAKGDFIKIWDPYLGSMVEQQGEYYRFHEIVTKEGHFSAQTTPMIARQLLPKEGFSWIASDQRALKAWIAILCGDDTGSGGISLLLRKLEEDLIKSQQADNQEFTEPLLQKDIESLPPSTFQDAPQTEAGELFVKWLRDGLSDGSISVNQKDSRVHTTAEGLVLIYPEIFQDFCNAYPRFKDWAVVYKQFNHLGLHALSGDDKLFYRFFGQSDNPQLSSRGQDKTANPSKAKKTNSSVVTVQGLLLKDYRSVVPTNFDASKVSAHVEPTKPQSPFAGVVLVTPSLPPLVPGGPNRPSGRI